MPLAEQRLALVIRVYYQSRRKLQQLTFGELAVDGSQ
jgi:hypothetical protein